MTDESSPLPSTAPADRAGGLPTEAAKPGTGESETEPRSRAVTGTLVQALSGAAGPFKAAARPIAREVDRLAAGARHGYAASQGARARRLRALARHPLPSLFELHPELRRAARRELGVRTVATDRIKGTAVEGPTQRGGDFLPLKPLQGADWRARWQRINQAVEGLVTLPPVELIKFGEDYWVVDGHNRVAAALLHDQMGVDASIVEYRQAGTASEPAPASIAASLAGSAELRAAGQGRLTRTARARSGASGGGATERSRTRDDSSTATDQANPEREG